MCVGLYVLKFHVFQLNIRDEEMNRLNAKIKQLQQEIRDCNSVIEANEAKVDNSLQFFNFTFFRIFYY